MGESSPSITVTHRLRGLDSIRAICALLVVFQHLGGPPLTAGADTARLDVRILNSIIGACWNGPAAVIVFFVISGFCIHYPHARTLRIASLGEYFTRRYVRIGIPMLAAILIARPLHVGLSLFQDSILWSLVAELIYYSLYPALLLLRRRWNGWRKLIAPAFVLAFLLAATKPGAKSYPSWGSQLNWLLGLPCWLLGCELASMVAGKRFGKPPPIWIWRAVIFVISIGTRLLRFHSPIGYPWSLNLFSIPLAVWLLREIHYYTVVEPSRLLEWVGRWSYSVYLFHIPARTLAAWMHFPPLGFFLDWAIVISFVLACSYCFHLIVERPSHVLARVLGSLG